MMRLIQLAIVAGLVGCASTPTVWHKDYATQADFAQDKYACMRSNTVAGYNPTTGENSALDVGLFNSCLESKGWALRATR